MQDIVQDIVVQLHINHSDTMQDINQHKNAQPYSQSPCQKMNKNDNNQPQNQNGLPPSQNRISEHAADLNQLKTEEFNYHWKALIATIILVVGQVPGLYLCFLQGGYLFQGILLCILFYLLYLLIAFCPFCCWCCWCCQDFDTLAQYLSNISPGQNFEDEYQALRRKVGHFVFDAVCYHYETRHHSRTVTDSDGNTRTQDYTTQEKVITHRATELLHPSHTRDESGAIDQVKAATQLIFVKFFFDHRFDTPISQSNFIGYYESFKRRNARNTDKHQDFSSNYVVQGLVPRKFSSNYVLQGLVNYMFQGLVPRKSYFVGEPNCNYKLWYYMYYILGFVGFLWPYSIWLQCKISRFSVVTTKVVTV